VRDEIKKCRGQLDKPHPSDYFQSLDSSKLEQMQTLITELNRVKEQTWEVRKQKSNVMKRERIQNLKKEGLGQTLAEKVRIPAGLAQSADALLQSVVSRLNSLTDLQDSLEDARSVRDKNPSNAQAQATVGQLEIQLHQSRVQVTQQQTEYKTVLGKVLAIESEERSLFLLAEDMSYLERIQEVDAWPQNVQQKLEMDTTLHKRLQLAEAEHQAKLRELSDKFSGNANTDALKAELSATAEATKDLQLEEVQLKHERDALFALLMEEEFKHEVQLQRYEEHVLQMFEEYRLQFEGQKKKAPTLDCTLPRTS
jgi:hypothetical protein